MDENSESLDRYSFSQDPVKFIVMDSECESEDHDLIHFPALQMTKVKHSNEKQKESTIFKDQAFTTDEEQQKQNVKVLVSDSEYDSAYKATKKGNSSSDSIVVVESEDPSAVESEDPMDVTVIEAPKGQTASGSSFVSNSKQDLGKYATVEMSNSQGTKVKGHLFPETVDSSEMDLFKGEEEDIVATPAEHISSLQLSAQPMLVPETVDDDVYAVSPSQDNFPHIIPGSPTSDVGAEESYDPNAEPTFSDNTEAFNVTVKNASQRSEKVPTETQESFHLHLSCTEYGDSQKQGGDEPSVQVLDRSDDVIVISQSEEKEIKESQDFILHLSQTQTSQKIMLTHPGSDNTESLKGSQEETGKQNEKEENGASEEVQSSKTGNQGSQQRSNQDHENEADMVTQTPMSQKAISSQGVSGEVLSTTNRSLRKSNQSLTIGMITTTQSQSSEHVFNLIRPEIRVGSEQNQSEETSIFSKVKKADKSSFRYVIQDDSDEEISFSRTNSSGRKTEENQPPKLIMSRTMSSEATSTGYQGSVESLSSSAHPGEQKDNRETRQTRSKVVRGPGMGSSKCTGTTLESDTQSYDVENYTRTVEREVPKGQSGSDKPSQKRRGVQNGQKNSNKSSQEESGVQKGQNDSAKSSQTQNKDSKTDSDNEDLIPVGTGDVSRLIEAKEQPHTSQSSQQNEGGDSQSKTVVVKPVEGFKVKDLNSGDKNKDSCQKQNSEQCDPYSFHGTQSQQENISAETNPVDYYRSRQVQPSIMETPPSSRKRKRKVHKKTGLKSIRKTKETKPSSTAHVCFSSPVSEVLTTPPSCMGIVTSVTTGNTLSTPAKSSALRNISPTVVGTIPTSADLVISQTFSPPQDRIEDDFPNFTTSTTLHLKPISTPYQIGTDMGPPTSVPIVTANTTIVSPSTSTLGLTRAETLAIPSDSQVEYAQENLDDVRIKTVTTTIVTYKVVETVEKIKFKSGAVKILSQHTERIPVKTHQKRTETTEEYVQSSVSPSRTNSTVTSGDLGDISSSLSRSGSSGPSSLDVNKVNTDIPVTQSLVSSGSRRSADSAATSPKDQTYSPLDVSSIHKDHHLSSENLFTSPDLSKEEGRRRESTGQYTEKNQRASQHPSASPSRNVEKGFPESSSDGITCAQRKVVTPVHRSGEESDPVFLLPKPTTTESSGESKVSPEVPNQDKAISTTKPDSKIDDAQAGLVGVRVMAKWKDTHFYPGVIKDDMGKSRFKIRFDDGDIMVVKGHEILLIDKLPIGQHVMVLSEDGYFYSGIIRNERKRGEVIQYSVEQDHNGKLGEFRYSQVILTEDQASCLIADMQCQLSQPEEDEEEAVIKNADVSLENLVVGKRRKQSRYEQVHTTEAEPAASPSSSKKSKKQEETALSSGSGTSRGRRNNEKDQNVTEASKKGKASFSPIPGKRASGPATSTPRVAKRRKITEESSPSSSSATNKDTTHTSRRSPRKGKGPAKPTKLFQGMYFMLTHVKKTPDILKMEKEVLQGLSHDTSNEESELEDDDYVPFEKDMLKSTITKEGGQILDKIDAHRKSRSMVYLISSGYVRTVKYFQALAAGYPCVSHQWILHSTQQNKLLDYKSYMLQAGISLPRQKVVEWNAHQGDLKDMVVMIESQLEKMKEEWTNILQLAGAKVVSKLHSKNATDGRVQVLVTDVTCKPLTLRTARSLSVPVVSTEWVIQCLVNGQIMDFTGQPRYEYDFAVV